MSTLHVAVTPQQLARRRPSAQPERPQPTRGPDGKALRPRPARGGPHEQPPRKTLADPPDRRVPDVEVRPISAARLRRRAGLKHLVRDPLLMPIDIMLDRWGDTPVIGADGAPRIAHVSFWPSGGDHVPPLDQGTAELIGTIVRASPRNFRKLLSYWYLADLPVADIADALELREQGVYEQRVCALWYVRGRLEGSGIHFTH